MQAFDASVTTIAVQGNSKDGALLFVGSDKGPCTGSPPLVRALCLQVASYCYASAVRGKGLLRYVASAFMAAEPASTVDPWCPSAYLSPI